MRSEPLLAWTRPSNSPVRQIISDREKRVSTRSPSMHARADQTDSIRTKTATLCETDHSGLRILDVGSGLFTTLECRSPELSAVLYAFAASENTVPETPRKTEQPASFCKYGHSSSLLSRSSRHQTSTKSMRNVQPLHVTVAKRKTQSKPQTHTIQKSPLQSTQIAFSVKEILRNLPHSYQLASKSVLLTLP